MKTTVQVFPGAKSNSQSFALLGGVVFKIETLSQVGEVVIEDSDAQKAADLATTIRRFFPSLQPKTTVTVTEATQADLIKAQTDSPSVAAELEGLLRHLRTVQAAGPLRVEITNASELKPDKPETPDRRIRVERDGSGKLTGAVVTDTAA